MPHAHATWPQHRCDLWCEQVRHGGQAASFCRFARVIQRLLMAGLKFYDKVGPKPLMLACITRVQRRRWFAADGGCIGCAPRSTVRVGFGASGRWRQIAASTERPLRACASGYGRLRDLFTPSPRYVHSTLNVCARDGCERRCECIGHGGRAVLHRRGFHCFRRLLMCACKAMDRSETRKSAILSYSILYCIIDVPFAFRYIPILILCAPCTPSRARRRA